MMCLADISFRSEGILCGLPPGHRRRLASQAKDVDCERCLRALAEIRAADPPKVSVERLRVDRPHSRAVKAHPTEKPVELMRRLVESSSGIDDVVLEMFAGSGSTLVAAILSGRKAIGVEVAAEHYETALARCVAAEGFVARRAGGVNEQVHH